MNSTGQSGVRTPRSRRSLGRILFQLALAVGMLGGVSSCGPRGVARVARDGSVQVRVVAASTNAVRIGEPWRVRLEVRYPSDARLIWPDPTGVSNDVVVLNVGAERSRRQGSTSMIAYRDWDLAAYSVGRHVVWTGAVEVLRGTDTVQRVQVPDTWLEVVSVLTNDGMELKPPRGLLTWDRGWPRWLWVLPLLALIAFVAAWFARGLGRSTLPPPVGPLPPSPAEVALRELAALRDSEDVAARRWDPVYTRLSWIVRRYIEAQMGLRAPEQTTQEFLHDAARSGHLGEHHRELLKEFLTLCDLVKFARAEPSDEDLVRLLASADRLIRETSEPPSSRENAENSRGGTA